jgi:hypothetical protein
MTTRPRPAILRKHNHVARQERPPVGSLPWRHVVAETLVGCFLAQRILSVPTTALGFPLALEAGTVPFATLGHRDV